MTRAHFLGSLPSPCKTSLVEQEQALEIPATHLVRRVDVGLGLEQRLGYLYLALF